MKTYTIYAKRNDLNNVENYIFNKEGFSIMAAIFQPLWALYNKMWLISVTLAIVATIFLMAENQAIINYNSIIVLKIGFMIFVGFNANDWYLESLNKKGFVLLSLISANNISEAKHKYLHLHENIAVK